MSGQGALTVLLLCGTVALAQGGKTAAAAALEAPVVLPIVFTRTISADHARIGDIVPATTSQSVRLANGTIISPGAKVIGHVVAANAFVRNDAPYARQQPSTLSIHFDSVQVGAEALPLNVTVRAMADATTSWGAREPKSTGYDQLGPSTQIGGDQLTPSQSEVVSRQGDVVAYNRRSGVYAHLIAHQGCDSSAVEVSVGIYSPSACGLYGFTDVVAAEMGSASHPSIITLTSSRAAPTVWKNSTALLEVLPSQGSEASR